MRLISLVLLAACSPLVTQADSTRIHLQRLPSEEKAPEGPTWGTSFDEAEAAAKKRHVAMLLYFTAKW